jgi:hypothetical protein
MKTLAELKAFFESELRPALEDLESERLRHLEKLRRLRLLLFAMLCPVGLLAVGDMTGEDIFNVIMIQFLYIALIFSTWALIHRKIFISYNPPEFKTRIIGRIVTFIDPELIYQPEKHVSVEDYLESRIFSYQDPDSCSGDDLVTGSIGKTGIAFSELHTRYRHTVVKGGDEWHTIFLGLFFYANFNKGFKGRTFVLPRQMKTKGYGEPVRLEDPRFEKYFIVYGSDQVEARYILTPALMERINDYRKKTGQNTYLSFVNNRIFIAIDYNKFLFEAGLRRSFLDFGLIREYYENMAHAVGIVEDLNLNTRIWN